MRVLYLRSDPASESCASRELSELAREANSRGNSVSVAGPPTSTADGGGPVAEHLLIAGMEDAPRLSGGDAQAETFAELSEERLDRYLEALDVGLGAIQQQARPEVVHVDHVWLVAAMARSIFHDVPVVASCHLQELQAARDAPNLLRRVLAPVRELDRVLVATPELARQAGSVFGLRSDRLAVVGQGIDTSLFRPPDISTTGAFERAVKRHALSVPARHELRMAVVSSSPDAPGLGSVLSAFGEVMASREGVAAIGICRGGEEQLEACERRVAGVAGLQLISAHSRAVVADVLRGCHVAVVLGPEAHVRALEALACGCRVLMPDFPGLRDWPKAGWVDSEALIRLAGLASAAPAAREEGDDRLTAQVRDCLGEQLERARERRIDRTAVRVVSRCSWSSVFGVVERVYVTLVGKRG